MTFFKMLILLVKNSIGDGNLINSCPLMYQSVNIQHEICLGNKKRRTETVWNWKSRYWNKLNNFSKNDIEIMNILLFKYA